MQLGQNFSYYLSKNIVDLEWMKKKKSNNRR